MNAGAASLPARAFLERTRELAALASSLEAARQCRGTVCLIGGEPGIGKSRLLTEFSAECERAGASVHWGSAWEAGGAPAYWPWIQILRSLLAPPEGREVLNRLPHLAPAIAQLVPEIGPHEVERAVQLEPEQARFRLMDAVAGFLQASAVRGTLVLMLEDAHAADPDSLVLLEFVARQLRGSQTLLLVSYRESEMHRPRVGNVITRIKREAVQLHLDRLSRDGVREYLSATTGKRPLEQTVAEIYALTEGHPLHLQEVVELGVSRGSFRAIPATLATAVRERVAALPADAQSLLGIASVFGRELTLEALAALTGEPLDRLEQQLAPAIAARFIERIGPGQLRFEHMLVRETLHDALPAVQRRAWHERLAQALLARGSDDAQLPWPQLAQHLEESGAEAREQAVEAWRRAAMQADARNAFDAAASCCSRALEALNRVSGAAPALRARLLLELATAQIRAGDVEAGRRNSTEAFNIAESLSDAQLMADAALAYGSIFTFGNVDPKMVQLLRKAFDALGERSPERKARVLARLAAAMQPAADPTEPIALAQESIRLARSTGDRRTLLITLRSAISAMMDLADPNERLAYNREYVALAESLGDSSECMRGYMRLVIDAMELGDASVMDHAIEQCEGLARQLVLPHYQWTAAAFRVLQATIRGELEQAATALERAERLAQRSQDPNAARALIVQRAALAELKGSSEEIRSFAQQLERSFAELPLADTYLKAYVLGVRLRCGETIVPGEELDEAHVRRVIQFQDIGALCAVGEVLAAAGERKLAAMIYESLLPRRGLCAHWGLVGMHWKGPVARVLGLLAVSLGKLEDANAHFAEALAVARRMNAKPWVERIEREWTSARKPDPNQSARTGTHRGIPAIDYFRLSRDGDVWVCECEGIRFSLRDSRGLQMLARLVAEANREFHVLDLSGAAGADATVDGGDSGELLDERARRDYRKRVEELRAEIEEAEATDEAVAAEVARAELEQLSAELARAFGLDGRARRAGSAVERARVNVQRRLKDAQARIAKECPTAGRHLEWAVRTGIFCSYRPG